MTLDDGSPRRVRGRAPAPGTEFSADARRLAFLEQTVEDLLVLEEAYRTLVEKLIHCDQVWKLIQEDEILRLDFEDVAFTNHDFLNSGGAVQ